MKRIKNAWIMVAIIMAICLTTCKKETIAPPTVKVFEGAITLSYTSASVSAEVTDQSGAEVKSRGFVYGLSGGAMDTIFCGSGTGVYSADLNNLQPNTTYVYEAFAKNTGGTGTSGKVTFTTKENVKPTVKTGEAENVTINTATVNGKVTDDGGVQITERGICWSTSNNPTMNGSHALAGDGLGEYTCHLTNLMVNTVYYVRAYAINSKGIAYGEEKSFTTKDYDLPQVTTATVTDIAQTTAKGGGNVTNDGGTPVTERGICWSRSHSPNISGHHLSNGNGTGNYTVQMTSLYANTTYYVRAYATNAKGTAYGNEVTFVTDANPPSVYTGNVTNITTTTATGIGNVTNDGGNAVTERGLCWGRSHNPTISSHHSSSGSGTGGFTVQMTNLYVNTTYYVRAYATNNTGTTYGNEVEFKTLSVSVPVVTTADITNITQTTATGGGNVTSDGGATVTERGLCWGKTHNPTIASHHVSSGSGTGNFAAQMTNLYANTTYYVRAYATNSQGTAYGNEVVFQTSNINLPSVSTNNVSNITQNTATCGGSVTNAGGGTVTARGVCWSTSQNPTINNQHTTNGSGTGNFTSNITGLTANKTYYVRAYATNSAGTAYGSQKTFTTKSEGTWLYYGSDNSSGNWGYTNGGTMIWAVRFPTTSLTPYSGTSITKVKVYLNESGTYKARIYKGGTNSPTTLLTEKSFSATAGGWKEVTISPITLTTNQPLWVSIEYAQSAGQYPAVCSAGIGNPNARWVYWGSNGWCDAYQSGWCDRDITWMIRVFVANSKGDKGLEIEIPQTPTNPNTDDLPKTSFELAR